MMTNCHRKNEKVLVVSVRPRLDTTVMSAITYPAAGRRGRIPIARPTIGFRRVARSLRLRRFDDLPGTERNASPSELALRSIPGVAVNYR